MTMPRSYVVVAFHDLPKDSLFLGGVPRNDFVRFSIDHTAYTMPEELRELLLKFINKSIHPSVRDADWTGRFTSTTHPGISGPFRACAHQTAAQPRRTLDQGKPAVQTTTERSGGKLDRRLASEPTINRPIRGAPSVICRSPSCQTESLSSPVSSGSQVSSDSDRCAITGTPLGQMASHGSPLVVICN
jgi:Putative oxalocrotonate tautomerase enzyme